MLFSAINLQDMEDVVNEWIVKNELGGNEDRWEDEEWGFFDELSLKDLDEDIFEDVEETGVETIISSSDNNFNNFFNYASKKTDVYLNKEGEEIAMKEWIEQVKSADNFTISLCECSANY